MTWSFRLGTWAGVAVYVHATFGLLLAWVAFVHWQMDPRPAAVASGLLFTLALFACVLLHEYGHALTARRYGIRTLDITLLPIGGLARLERQPDDPRQELWVALAGPAVNVVLAVMLLAAHVVVGAPAPLIGVTITEGGFIERLVSVNVLLAAFNLLPAFPMDGGRVLRAGLALRMDYARATALAARIARVLAVLLGVAGFFFNPFLVVIAVFVWLGATQEAAATEVRSALSGVRVGDVMVTEFHALPVDARLADAVRLLLTGAQTDFPIVDGDRVVGILTRADLLAAVARDGEGGAVAAAMRRGCPGADATEPMAVALRRMQESTCATIPVLRDGRLAGLLTLDNLSEYLSLRDARRRR